MKLSVGQIVRWNPAPMGVAQVDELRRKNVRLVYITRRGTLRYAITKPTKELLEGILFAGSVNPLNRAKPRRKEKVYEQ